MTAKRRKMSPWTLLALTAGPAVIVGSGLWLLADLVPECMAEVRLEYPSPDLFRVASVVDRACGGGVTRTDVVLREMLEPFHPDSPVIAFSVPGTSEITLEWVAEEILRVGASPEPAPTIAETEIMGIDVTYD